MLNYDALIKKIIVATILPITLTACKPGGEKAVQLAQESVSHDMKDPDSTKFRNVLYTQKGEKEDGSVSGVVCGEVNSKNSFGAYSGFSPFVVVITMKSKGFFSSGVNYSIPVKHVYQDAIEASRGVYKEFCPSRK
jgi:hypothetical protein